MRDTILIYSGGLDSTSALYAHKENIKLAVTFNYGARHNNEECKMAALNCSFLGISHKIINLKNIFEGMQSALLGTEDVPHGHYEDDSMRTTVVPFRNGVMLSIATAIAENLGANAVMIASHAGDNAVYPDCRPLFNSAMQSAMLLGTYNGVVLHTPFEYLNKREVAYLGVRAGMSPEHTYSCYEGKEEQCGKCSTCVERLWALGEMTDEEVEATRCVK